MDIETNIMSNTRLRMILISVLIMTFMMTLDSSILNVALPTLAKSLNVPTSLIDWACTAYLISMCAFVLIFGKVADIIGKTKVFQAGTVVFTVGSLLCSMSGSLISLIISRLIQGIGASAAMSSNLGIISETYPVKNRAKALSGVSSAVALGTLVGPIAGGAILNYFSWKVIFLINLPIGVIAFILGFIYLPKNKARKAMGHFDINGSIFIVLAISAVISSLTMMQAYSSIYLHMLLFLGFVFFFCFVLLEKKADVPLVKVTLLTNKRFVINLLSITFTFICIGTYNIMMPFYLQNGLGYTPGKAGLIMITQPIIMALVAPISGILADQYGYRPISALGMFIFGGGALFQGLQYRMDTGIFLIVVGIVIFAAGNALSQTPNNALLMSSVRPEDYGFAGSIGSLVRYLGISVGLTLSTSALYALMSHKVGYPVKSFLDNQPEVFIYGLRYVFISACVILWVTAFLMLRMHIKERMKNKR
jgi:EmrB/QacA subfamily drug resistance transporter